MPRSTVFEKDHTIGISGADAKPATPTSSIASLANLSLASLDRSTRTSIIPLRLIPGGVFQGWGPRF